MRPQLIVENVQTVSDILIQNGLGALIDHLDDGPSLRARIREHEQQLALSRRKLPRDLVMIYNAYPSNGAIFRREHEGIAKRTYMTAHAAIYAGAARDMNEALKLIRASRKARKQSETRARQEKHRLKRSKRK